MLDASSKFSQVDPAKFKELVTCQGLDNEKELVHLLH